MATATQDPLIDYDRSKLVDIDIYGTDFKRRPYEQLSKWSTEAPFYVEIAGLPQAFVARHSAIKRASSDYEFFTSEKRPWGGMEKFYYFRGLPVVTDNDPPTHTRLRRLMAPAFSPRRLAEVEVKIKEIVTRLLDGFEQAGRFDAASDFGRQISVEVLFGLVLGLPEEDWPIFRRLGLAMHSFTDITAGGSPNQEFQDAWEVGRQYCEKLITDHYIRQADGVIGSIIAAHLEDGKISIDELMATLFVMYLGGQGGAANAIPWTLLSLCKNEDQLKLLQKQPELAQQAVDESVRMDPNGYLILRFATQDCELEGLRLWKNMPLLLSVGAPNLDPNRYEDPLRFDITRVAKRDDVTFGHGVHHCIGTALARMIGRIGVDETVRRFPRIRLADPDHFPEIIGPPKERGPDSVPLLID